MRPPTANVDAYDLYLKGHALIKQRGPALLRAVEVLEQAIAADPRLALAHAELAEALLLMGLYGMVRPAEISERARQATFRALELEPKLVLGHVVLGLFRIMGEFDLKPGCAALAHAVELDPQDIEARTLQAVFELCYIRGRHDAARAQLEGVIAADPLSANARAQLAIVLTWGGQGDEAVAQARRGIELDPNAFYPQWTLLHALSLGSAPHEALEIGPALLARFGRHPWLMMGLCHANRATGRRDQADALYAELEARSRGEYVQPAALAVAALGAGREDRALDHLRHAAEVKDPLLTAMALQWPGFARLRESVPEYARVLRDLGWTDTGKTDSHG